LKQKYTRFRSTAATSALRINKFNLGVRRRQRGFRQRAVMAHLFRSLQNKQMSPSGRSRGTGLHILKDGISSHKWIAPFKNCLVCYFSSFFFLFWGEAQVSALAGVAKQRSSPHGQQRRARRAAAAGPARGETKANDARYSRLCSLLGVRLCN